jgi:peptidoglycan/LPS O-acetylase OafA/YrhL
MLREREDKGEVNLKGFYVRRFFRIVPIYLVVVLLYVPALWISDDATKISEYKIALPWLLTFLQEFRPAAAGNVFGQAWTLGIEEKFYLLWPLIIIGLYPFRRRATLWVSLIGLGVFLLPHTFSRSYGGLLIGGVIAIAMAKSTSWKDGLKLPEVDDRWLLLFVAIGYVMTYIDPKYVLCFSAGIGLIVASLVVRPGLMRSILSSPIAVFIGKRSYAMYLIHILAINFVEKVMVRLSIHNWILIVAVSFGVTLLGASLLQILVEKPCIAFGRQVSTALRSREPLATSLSATA